MVTQVFSTSVYNLQRAIEIMDNSGLILNETDAMECSQCIELHLQTYAWFAAFFWEARETLFRMRPKHHCVYHQAVQIREWRLNQSLFHTWDDESFLGKIKAIWQKCHGATASKRTFERYLLRLALKLEQYRRLARGPS